MIFYYCTEAVKVFRPKIYCVADPTFSYNIKQADKYQYHGKIGFLWFDIFLKSIINP